MRRGNHKPPGASSLFFSDLIGKIFTLSHRCQIILFSDHSSFHFCRPPLFVVPGPDPFHYLSPPDLSSGPKYISSISPGPKYQDRSPSANSFPIQGRGKQKSKGEKKYALLPKRRKQFASRFREGDYSTDFSESMGLAPNLVPNAPGGHDKFTSQHTSNDITRESGRKPGPGFRKNLGGQLGGGQRHCERGECRGTSQRRATGGKLRNRRRQRKKKNKKYMTNKRQNGVVEMDEETGVGNGMEDMMDIRELQLQQRNREHGREMVDYPLSLNQQTASSLGSSSSSSSSSPSSSSSSSSSSAEQLQLPFLSSFPRASTIEQLIGDPLDGWDIHMPNSQFFEDN